jgi:hypothetical protein
VNLRYIGITITCSTEAYRGLGKIPDMVLMGKLFSVLNSFWVIEVSFIPSLSCPGYAEQISFAVLRRLVNVGGMPVSNKITETTTMEKNVGCKL